MRSASDLIKFPEMFHSRGSIGYGEKMLIGYLLMMGQPKLIIETGVFREHTTRFLADFILLNRLPNCRIVSFDVPEVVKVLRQNSYFDNHPEIEFIPGYLPKSLKNFLERCNQLVDFVIIDSEHSYKEVTQELELIHPKLKPGAYIFCHDYREHDPEYAGVRYAVDKFVAINKYNMLPLNVTQEI